MNMSTKQKATHRHREQTCSCQRGWVLWVGQGRSRTWISTCKLLSMGWVNNTFLLEGIDNYVQYSVITITEKMMEKNISV